MKSQLSYLCIFFVALCSIPAAADDNWPQASGPYLNWQKANGVAPTEWSVVRDQNIVWRTKLPEGGQSSVTVWGDYAFLTTHKPMQSENEITTSTDIVGYCLNASTGEIRWTVDIPGSVAVGTAGIFSDATVFAPVTDGEYVWFFNRSGGIGCFDFKGQQVWLREYSPRNRHTNRQCEPILLDEQLITQEVLDKEAGKLVGRHKAVPKGIPSKSVWTYLYGLDKKTGKERWRENVGTVIHHTPVVNFLANGEPAIVHARGGAHQPLETPAGLSLTSLAAGKMGTTIWSTELPKLDPPFNSHWNENYVFAFHSKDHVVLDTSDGREISRRNLNEEVDYWRRDGNSWKLDRQTNVQAGRKHANTNQTNIVVGEWHYFLAHDIFAIGRVHTSNSTVEYLEVPVQNDASSDGNNWIWEKSRAVPISTLNSRGINIAGDKRASRTGWGHVSAASPILVGHHLYFPVMTGTVYVIDTRAKQLSGGSLVAINDLGPTGETWTLSQFTHSKSKLFIRTMKEAICIGSN